MHLTTDATQDTKAMPEQFKGMPPKTGCPERQLGENEPQAWALAWCGAGLADCALTYEAEVRYRPMPKAG